MKDKFVIGKWYKIINGQNHKSFPDDTWWQYNGGNPVNYRIGYFIKLGETQKTAAFYKRFDPKKCQSHMPVEELNNFILQVATTGQIRSKKEWTFTELQETVLPDVYGRKHHKEYLQTEKMRRELSDEVFNLEHQNKIKSVIRKFLGPEREDDEDLT